MEVGRVRGSWLKLPVGFDFRTEWSLIDSGKRKKGKGEEKVCSFNRGSFIKLNEIKLLV